MCQLHIIGYFPNKLHTFFLYSLDLNTYYLYVAISSWLIWMSHVNRFLIYLSCNDEFYDVFIILTRKSKTISSERENGIRMRKTNVTNLNDKLPKHRLQNLFIF